MKNKYKLYFRELDNIFIDINNYNKETLENNGYYKARHTSQFSSRFITNYFSRYLQGYVGEMSFYSALNLSKLTTLAEKLIDSVFTTYQLHICCSLDNIDDIEEMTFGAEYFVLMLIKKFDEVYPRYETLFNLYNENKDKLIGKLQTITSTESTNSSATNNTHSETNSNTHLYKNTPESSIDISSAQYNSSVDKNDGTNGGSSSSRTDGGSTGSATTTIDKDLIINELNEVQEKYRNLMKDFINEFRGLFIESSNYKEA